MWLVPINSWLPKETFGSILMLYLLLSIVIHHIVCENTIDEQILSALERKDLTQAALMNAVKAQLEVQK